MAKYINKKNHDIYWSDDDIACAVEEAYWELHDFLAVKRLDGHNAIDLWYMLIDQKLSELIDIMEKCPFDELDEDLKPIY